MQKFLQKYNLKPGDRIVTPRSGWRLIQHHAIYWGMDSNGVHWIIENQDYVGVQLIELRKFLQRIFEVKRIERFTGNNHERSAALERGERLIGRRYDLFNFNCEHFANYVQLGRSFSKQMENVSGGLKFVAGFSLLIMAIGAAAKR